MMGVLADAMLSHGGHVIGVIPQNLARVELMHDAVKDMRVTANMHERKALMHDLADGYNDDADTPTATQPPEGEDDEQQAQGDEATAPEPEYVQLTRAELEDLNDALEELAEKFLENTRV